MTNTESPNYCVLTTEEIQQGDEAKKKRLSQLMLHHLMKQRKILNIFEKSKKGKSQGVPGRRINKKILAKFFFYSILLSIP